MLPLRLLPRAFEPPQAASPPSDDHGGRKRPAYASSTPHFSRRCRRILTAQAQAVAILGADEFCGEGCLAGQPRRISTVMAMTECMVMRLEKTSIIRVLHDEPGFSELFISHLLARTIRVEEDLVDQLFNSSEKRLARLLLLLANFGKEARPEPIIAKISQETLAEMIGTTRSRSAFS